LSFTPPRFNPDRRRRPRSASVSPYFKGHASIGQLLDGLLVLRRLKVKRVVELLRQLLMRRSVFLRAHLVNVVPLVAGRGRRPCGRLLCRRPGRLRGWRGGPSDWRRYSARLRYRALAGNRRRAGRPLSAHLGYSGGQDKGAPNVPLRSEEHTSELQSPDHLVCRLLLEKKKKQ